ncbi:Type 1 glutamine amidotransferase-like domain-containing protein [Dubosiella newyorkensis]|nr:Type 1 glutamine amidotransferase-like domain-containing protein [Dubosiella newyorkensis]
MVNILMNTSMIDEAWCFPILKRYIKPNMKVCVVALSFFDDTKMQADWNKQYQKGSGIWYRANHDVFFKYGIKDEDISWINYFQDSKEAMKEKIESADLVLFTGGAPDLMMKRIKEKKLKKALQQFDGIVIGYSAGAMIQLDEYHISPDPDYPSFSYERGLAYRNDFDIEVHYDQTKTQLASIKRVLEEKKKPVYAIYEKGGLIVEETGITCFGKVDLFE